MKQAILIKYQRSGAYGIKVLFPFSYSEVTKVKSLPGRKYHPKDKLWTCPLSLEAAEMLKRWQYIMDPKILKFMDSAKIDILELDNDIDIPGIKQELYPFQKQGVSFIEAKNGRALIGDEMGLGKTIQALAWLQLHPELRPALIVCPASLKLNWEREAELWMEDPQVEVISGKKPYILTGQIIIMNYDILPNKYKKEKNRAGKIVDVEILRTGWIDYIIDIKPKVAVADEVHYTKSGKAHRTKALKKLAKAVPNFIGLSGTPIINRPVEFFNIINIIDRTVFPDYWKFTKRYCDAKRNGFGWDMSGSANTEELHKILTERIMIRRLKKDVLKELPDKSYSFIPIELDNQNEYDSAEKNFLSWVKKHKGAEAVERASNAQALAEIEGLKQIAVRGKLKQAIKWIEDFLESDQKLVIFATHKFVIAHLMDSFKNIAVKVDGSVSGTNRQLAVDKFQNDVKTRLFIGNIKAAGVGLTLTASSSVVFLEYPWTPGELSQASDRVHRIGQENAVNIYYLLAEYTIEEQIAELLDEKRKVLDSVLDGKRPEKGSLLMDLITKYSKDETN